MKVINFTEARKHLRAVINRVIADADYTIISSRDSEDCVLMSLDTFNSLMETDYLLRSPKNAEMLQASIKQLEGGESLKKGLIEDE